MSSSQSPILSPMSERALSPLPDASNPNLFLDVEEGHIGERKIYKFTSINKTTREIRGEGEGGRSLLHLRKKELPSHTVHYIGKVELFLKRIWERMVHGKNWGMIHRGRV